MTTATDPLLRSVDNSLEAIILTMHQEDFSRSGLTAVFRRLSCRG